MNVFKFEMKLLVGQMFVWLIVLTVLLGVFMAFFPALQDESMMIIIKQGIDAMPNGVRQFIFPYTENNLDNLIRYTSNIIRFLNVFFAIYAVSIGLNSLAKEQADGTIDYLYSIPNSRSDIVSSKLSANIIILLLFTILMAAINVGMIWIIDNSMDLMTVAKDIGQIYLGTFMIGLVFMSVGMLISSLMKSTDSNGTVATLLIVLSIVVGLLRYISSLKLPSVLSWISPVYTLSPIVIVTSGLPIMTFAVYFAVFLICTVLTYTVYMNKDFRA